MWKWSSDLEKSSVWSSKNDNRKSCGKSCVNPELKQETSVWGGGCMTGLIEFCRLHYRKGKAVRWWQLLCRDSGKGCSPHGEGAGERSYTAEGTVPGRSGASQQSGTVTGADRMRAGRAVFWGREGSQGRERSYGATMWQGIISWSCVSRFKAQKLCFPFENSQVTEQVVLISILFPHRVSQAWQHQGWAQ